MFKFLRKLFRKSNTVRVSGRIKLACVGSNGVEKWNTGWIKNGITTVGFAAYADLVGDVNTIAPFTYLAVGTSSTAFASNQTALVGEITDTGLARAAATVTLQTTTTTNDTLQLYKEWTATGSKTVEEIGVFNASSGGTMSNRALTGTKTLANTDKLQATYQIVFAD